MTRRARALAAAAAVVIAGLAALAVTALVGDRPARGAEVSARADAVCAAAHDRLADLPPLDGPLNIAAAGPRAVAVTLDTARRLLAIDGPAERLRAVRGYAQHLLHQAELISRLQEAAGAGDRKTAVALIAAIQDNSRRGRQAGRQVSRSCGGVTRPPSPAAAPAGQAV